MPVGALGGSALTDKRIKVPRAPAAGKIGSKIPVTYVPARNTIFLAFGLGHGGFRATPIREVLPIGAASTLEVPGAPTAIPLPVTPRDRLATTCPGWTRSSWATP